MEAFPNLKVAGASARRHIVGRRAAGDRDRARADDEPELLLLDEVSLGLSPLVVDRVYARLEALKTSGVAMVLVEQDLKRAMATASRTICMLEGAIAIEGPTQRAHAANRSREAYFGLRRPSLSGGAALIFLNQIIQGVLLGGYYALIACGLSFMFGVMRIINLAHGSLAVLAAYALFVLADRFGDRRRSSASSWSSPAMALVGWALQRARARAQRARRAAGAGALDLRPVDRHRQPAVRGVRRRHPLARALYRRSLLRQLVADRRIAIGKLAALTIAVAVALLGGLQIFLDRIRRSAARSARPRRIPTRSASSASTRGASTRSPRRSRMATVAVAGAFLGMRATFDPYAGAAAADLRLRGGGDRRRRIAMGHADRRHRARRRAEPRRARSIRKASSSPATSVFLVVLFARLFFGDLGRAFRRRSSGGAA